MKKYIFHILAIVAVLLLLSSCTNVGEIKSNLDQEFTLSIGQSTQIEGESLQISFEDVLEDSRCEIGANCIWEGRVSLALEIKDNSSPYKMILMQYGLNNQYSNEIYKAYQFAFKVNPYPELGTEIVKNDYQLLMTVSKR